ncbi:Ig-like domain-containing protein [Fulvivirga kasyanovii]
MFCFAAGFAQSKCLETVTLPNEAAWGGGDSQGSMLIGNTYGPGEGPGIYIVADGGYRLYLNGELLAYDNAAGRVQFVPMTFLPGYNAISVAGINGQDAPGVLVQIDELEKSYYSGSSWRANAEPSDNAWKKKYYNDLQWSYAQEQSGSITSTPSGVSFSGFPAGSKSKWIWSSNSGDQQAVLRYVFKIQAVGFGRNTTGGEDAEIVKVTSAEELIEAAESEKAKIILVPEGTIDFRNFRKVTVCYQPCTVNTSESGGYKGYWNSSGTCPGAESTTKEIQQWERRIWVQSNKTIIGMGRGASLRGVMLYNRDNSNVIMRNLKIWDINPHIIEALDGVLLYGATKMWIDHCSFKWISDGNDVYNTKEATFSWNRWNGYNEYLCDGRDNYSALVQGSDITFDHIWWEGSRGRTPKLYGDAPARIHMINNYHSDNTFYSSYSGGPDLLLKIENSHFDGVRIPTVRVHGGVIYSSGNLYENIEFHSGDNWAHTSEPKDATANFHVDYPYTLDNVNDVKSICTSRTGAGAQWGTMPEYDDAAGQTTAGPSVSIRSPSSGQGFTDPASITINVFANGENGIAKVAFYHGSDKLGEDTTAPYSWMITDPENCTYSIVAVAYDNKGLVAYSTPTTFTATVNPTNDNSGLVSSVPDASGNLPLKVFPNPVKNTMKIEGKFTGKWSLYDLQNRKVMSGSQRLVQMEGLKQGIYVLRIEEHVIRIIKNN